MKLRDEYEGSQKVDRALFSGKGLRNLGNTWFFNSIIQCLTATRDLYFLLYDNVLSQTGRGYPFNEEFRDLMLEMRSGDADIVSPVDMFRAVIRKNSRFRGYQQQDAHDLLMMMFDNLDKEAAKKKKKPLWEYVFGGKTLSSGNL